MFSFEMNPYPSMTRSARSICMNESEKIFLVFWFQKSCWVRKRSPFMLRLRTLRSNLHSFFALNYVPVSAVKVPVSVMESLNCTMNIPSGKCQWGSFASSNISHSGAVMW